MPLSTYLRSKLYKHVYQNTSYTPPAAVYAALYIGDPTGAGAEVSGGGYERVEITFGADTNGVGSNSSAVVFPTATADWGDLTHVVIFDASSGGNMLSWKGLATTRTVSAGETPTFIAGDLDATWT